MKVTCEPKHIRTVNSDKTSKLAYASITLDDAFVVHGLSIINGKERRSCLPHRYQRGR